MKYTKLLLLIIVNTTFAQDEKLTANTILKNGTVLTYTINELNKQIGLGEERVVEGESLGDEIKITLTQTDSDLQTMQVNDGGKIIYGDPIKLKDGFEFNTYKNFIDVFFSKTDALSVILNDEMFRNDNIVVYPEWEKESYIYNKSKSNMPFTFLLNGKEVKSTINYYKTNKSNKTMATTFAFLNENELPIQTHLYYEYDGSDEYGIFYKLVSIETKN